MAQETHTTPGFPVENHGFSLPHGVHGATPAERQARRERERERVTPQVVFTATGPAMSAADRAQGEEILRRKALHYWRQTGKKDKTFSGTATGGGVLTARLV